MLFGRSVNNAPNSYPLFVDLACFSSITKSVFSFLPYLETHCSHQSFLHEHSWFTGQQGRGNAISLIPLYYFHPPHRHLDTSWEIAAESSPLLIASSWTRTGSREHLGFQGKSLTTKLRALSVRFFFNLR